MSNKRDQAGYKKDLDKLFKSGGDVPERFKGMMDKLKEDETDEEREWREAVDVLRNAEDFREFATLARTFHRAGNALPDDEDLLLKFLDHPNEGLVQAALAHYVDLGSRRDFDRVAPLQNRLKTLKLMAEEPRTKELIAEVESLL